MGLWIIRMQWWLHFCDCDIFAWLLTVRRMIYLLVLDLRILEDQFTSPCPYLRDLSPWPCPWALSLWQQHCLSVHLWIALVYCGKMAKDIRLFTTSINYFRWAGAAVLRRLGWTLNCCCSCCSVDASVWAWRVRMKICHLKFLNPSGVHAWATEMVKEAATQTQRYNRQRST